MTMLYTVNTTPVVLMTGCTMFSVSKLQWREFNNWFQSRFELYNQTGKHKVTKWDRQIFF